MALLAAALVLGPGVAAPQTQGLVRVIGSIQWSSGARMQVLTDTGASVVVDLTQVEQSTYRALRNGEPVVVDGVLAPDRRRIIAVEIWRDDGRGSWTQSP